MGGGFGFGSAVVAVAVVAVAVAVARGFGWSWRWSGGCGGGCCGRYCGRVGVGGRRGKRFPLSGDLPFYILQRVSALRVEIGVAERPALQARRRLAY